MLLNLLFIVYFVIAIPSIFFLSWQQLLITYIMFWILTDLVNGLFLHRWSAHNLWNPPVWFQNIMSVVSMTALIGTPISYSAWHRTHHRTSDTTSDPHSPKYMSYLKIIFGTHTHTFNVKKAGSRLKNKWIYFLTKHETVLVYSINIILFLLLPIEIFLMWVTAVAMSKFWMVFGTGIMCHGYSKGVPTNIPWMYPLIFNDCNHEDHHRSPKLQPLRFDPWVWIITKLRWT